nr:nicotinate (nicotinamide) nucleotide adenylyltransferase [Desulfobulbaceae bacterium]
MKDTELIEGDSGHIGERVGVFGGTFDPVHNGHCAVVSQFQQQCSLDSVIVVPSANPPHKLSAALTDFEHRFAMLSLAFSNTQDVFLSRLEQYREGPSYTIDTLRQLKRGFDGNREWFFAVGEDTLAEIHTWKQYTDILAEACVVVFTRKLASAFSAHDRVREFFPGYRLADDQLSFFENGIERIRLLDMPVVDISSSRIRQAIVRSQDWSEQVPKAVAAYILDHHLYI